MMLEEAAPWGGGAALVNPTRVRQAHDMGAKEDREKRLAAALRDNLRRRKAAGADAGAEPLAEPAERDGDPQEDRDQG